MQLIAIWNITSIWYNSKGYICDKKFIKVHITSFTIPEMFLNDENNACFVWNIFYSVWYFNTIKPFNLSISIYASGLRTKKNLNKTWFSLPFWLIYNYQTNMDFNGIYNNGKKINDFFDKI